MNKFHVFEIKRTKGTFNVSNMLDLLQVRSRQVKM